MKLDENYVRSGPGTDLYILGFRTLSWRANSSEKAIVLGELKAEKDIVEKYKDIIDVDKIKYNDGKGTIYS